MHSLDAFVDLQNMRIDDAAAGTIRVATPADAAAIASLAQRTAIDTFASQNAPDDMAAFLAVSFGPEIQRRELADPAITYLVVERAGDMIAYAMLRERSTPHVADPTALELQRFYVDKSCHGSGIAQTLMADCVARAAERGAGALWLGVWERNDRALRFYTAQGFAAVGMQTFTVGTDEQHDVVMARIIARAV